MNALEAVAVERERCQSKCSICGRPATYMGEHAAVNLRGGRQAHIYCVQRKRGWSPDQIEAHTRQRMIAAGEDW